MIGIDDGRATGHDEIAEQPELGGEIRLEVWMIVEMVAREICEGGRSHPQAIEAKVVEPMRRSLDREMRDAFAGERVERAMQRDRIGRGERAVDGSPGETRPMVPMLAEGWPSPRQIWRVKAATDVLPLVPVTAAMVGGWAARIWPRRARAPARLGTD